ncbi:hypothetical protein AC1031_003274 [Aphanomyces cochlioides]|nr:hypothetical protein AC1031_003274 [Aphanomyces cochlioides]
MIDASNWRLTCRQEDRQSMIMQLCQVLLRVASEDDTAKVWQSASKYENTVWIQAKNLWDYNHLIQTKLQNLQQQLASNSTSNTTSQSPWTTMEKQFNQEMADLNLKQQTAIENLHQSQLTERNQIVANLYEREVSWDIQRWELAELTYRHELALLQLDQDHLSQQKLVIQRHLQCFTSEDSSSAPSSCQISNSGLHDEVNMSGVTHSPTNHFNQKVMNEAKRAFALLRDQHTNTVQKTIVVVENILSRSNMQTAMSPASKTKLEKSLQGMKHILRALASNSDQIDTKKIERYITTVVKPLYARLSQTQSTKTSAVAMVIPTPQMQVMGKS